MLETNPKQYFIVLDDDPMVPKIIEKITGISCLHYATSKAVAGRAERYHPMAAFIDIHLDEDDCGLDAIPQLRVAWTTTPIIVVTQDESADAIGQALAVGANDFIKKPIGAAELKARLKARIAEMNERAVREKVAIGDAVYEYRHGTLQGKEKIRHLSPTERRILECLINANGMVVTRKELKSNAWGHVRVSDNALDKKIFDLRSTLKEISDQVAIKSVYGVGIQLEF